jgi:hypothetical protein
VRDQLVELLDEGWKSDAPWVSSQGALPAPPNADKLSDADRQDERRRAYMGWQIAAQATKADRHIADLAKVVKLVNHPELRRLLERRTKVSANKLPTVRQRAPRAKGLDAGTVAFEITFPGELLDRDGQVVFSGAKPGISSGKPAVRANAKAKPVSVVLLVVPDGERTWFAVSSDETFVAEKLLKLKTLPAETLAQRDSLGELKAAPAVGGGFVTAEAFLTKYLGFVSRSRASRVLNALPHHGQTPLPVTLVTARQGSSSTATWSLRFPKAALLDMGALFPALIGAEEGVLSPPTLPAPNPPMPRRPKR